MKERSMYEDEGLSLRIIGQLLGVNHESVRRRVKAQGGRMRPRGTNK